MTVPSAMPHKLHAELVLTEAHAYMLPPRIWLFGAPAAGKTTARHLILEWMAVRGSSVAPLGIEETQRLLMPQGSEDGSFRYDEHGALVILDPERRISEALNLLLEQCVKAARNAGFVAELTHRDMMHVLRLVPPTLFAGALVLHFEAPVELRVARNVTRGAAQVPSEVVVTYPEGLSVEQYMFLQDRGATVRRVTSRGTLEALRGQIYGCMAEFFVNAPSAGL